MKYLNKIFEGRNLGDLYHILDYNKLLYVLENNKITSYKAGRGRISLTRNKMMNSYLGDGPQAMFKLVIDGDKLSNNYKIKPYRFFSMNGMGFEEFEEQVQSKKIENAFKYIKSVVLIKKRTESLMRYPWMKKNQVSDYLTSIMGDNNLPNMIGNIKNKLKEHNIDFLVQEDTVINTNDKYIDFIINHPIKKIETKQIVLYRGRLPKERQFAYDDSVLDLNGKIISRDLVIGNLYLDLEKMSYIEINNGNKEKIKQKIKPKIFDSSDDKAIPYIFEIRKEDNGTWKVSMIKPLESF